MIYKVAFKRQDINGITVIETKIKGVEKVSVESGNGIKFLGEADALLAFFPTDALLYAEKVEELEIRYEKELRSLEEGDSIYVVNSTNGGATGVFTVKKVDRAIRLIHVESKQCDGWIIKAIPFEEVEAVLPSFDSFHKGRVMTVFERR